MDTFFLILIWIILLAFLGFIVAIGIHIEKDKKLHANDNKNTIQNDINYQFEETELIATVIDVSCSTRVAGTKSVKSVEEFFVSFETENGEIIKLQVLKEMYDGFEIGQNGILKLVDGDFFGFEI